MSYHLSYCGMCLPCSLTILIRVEDIVMTSDSVLVTRIKCGNQQALEELFSKYYDRLCDFAFQYVRSFDLSEEVVSDVFFKVWLKREALTVTGNFKAYLYTAVR